eukprot:NODE_841_length_3770_cov_0.565241.p2 type:complete len:234 gc:universal NODE_841_length_3770_cov_0.565241:1753-1052(-)
MDVHPLKLNSLMILQAHPKKLVQKYAAKNMRISSREFHESRKTELHQHVEMLKNYTLIKRENSVVLVWIRLEISEKRLDCEKGYFIPHVTLPRIQNKLHSERLEIAFTFAEMIQEHIEEWNVLDLKQLLIEDSHCWCLYADLTVLNDDGNLYSVIWDGLIECLKQTRLPKLKELEVVDNGELLRINPISVEKVVTIEGKTFADPDKREEDNSDTYTMKCKRNGKLLWHSGAFI